MMPFAVRTRYLAYAALIAVAGVGQSGWAQVKPTAWPPSDLPGARLYFGQPSSVPLASEAEEDAVLAMVQAETNFCEADPWRQFKWVTSGRLLMEAACATPRGMTTALFALDRGGKGMWQIVSRFYVPMGQVVPQGGHSHVVP